MLIMIMVERLEIVPGKGLYSLLFGASIAEVENQLGKPNEIAFLDDIEEHKSTVWHYWETGFSLFFDENNEHKLSSVEIDNTESEMWGQKIFRLTETQILELFKSKGIIQHELEKEEWGETRITFDELNIDFYFENHKLVSINYGKITAVKPLQIQAN